MAEADQARRNKKNTQPFPAFNADTVEEARRPVSTRPPAVSTRPPAVSTRPPTAPPVPAKPAPRALRDARFAAGKTRAKRPPRWPWYLVLLSIAAAAIWFVKFRPSTLPTGALQATAGNQAPCANANWCVVAYIAPWDPATERSVGTINRLAATLADTDMALAVVIAPDETDEMTRLAEQFSADTWLDPTGTIEHGLKLTMMPSWLLVDSRGRVQKVVQGTHFPFRAQLEALGLSQLEPAPPQPKSTEG
jgi:hypothetical protein